MTVSVQWHFLMVPLVGLRCVIVVFPLSYSLTCIYRELYNLLVDMCPCIRPIWQCCLTENSDYMLSLIIATLDISTNPYQCISNHSCKLHVSEHHSYFT